jgi:hypothetical protein
VLSAPTTGSQFLIDAATNPLSNYVGPNGVEIVTEPTLDLLRFTPLGGPETYSSAQVEPGKIIPLGTYVSWIVGGELFLVQTASLAQQSSSYDASWIVDKKWFDSVATPATSRYTRSLYSGFTTLTSLTLEYRANTGVIHAFTLTDFTTDFENNAFWNTANGVTRLVPTGVGQVYVAIVLENNKRDITIAIQDLAVNSTLPARWLQFRNVAINGRYADNLFGDAAINANTAAIAAIRDLDTKFAIANAGVAITIGGIQVQLPSSGNRSIQARSNTGGNISVFSRAIHHNGGDGSHSTQTLGPTTWLHINSGWTFHNAGEWERVFIRDDTTQRMYDITMVIGSSYNNNWFACIELPYGS